MRVRDGRRTCLKKESSRLDAQGSLGAGIQPLAPLLSIEFPLHRCDHYRAYGAVIFPGVAPKAIAEGVRDVSNLQVSHGLKIA